MMTDTDQKNIDFILQVAASAEADGLHPETMLDPDELEEYNAYMQANAPRDAGHYSNLVDVLDGTTKSRLASDIINWVRWDEDTRKDWMDRETKGIRLLGVSDQVDDAAPFKGASTVVHPLLSEAVTQFHARALAEIWPPEGPVKGIALGDQTEQVLAQAERVQTYMNYQYTEDMPGAFEEEDAMLFRLPLSGSCFKKVFYDPLKRKLCSRLIEPSDFIVPFSATDLESAPRYTHRYREMLNTIRRKQSTGFYSRSAKVFEATNESNEYPEVLDEIDHTEGRQRISQDDERHTILETYVYLDLAGFEDIDAETGAPSGIALPYIVWVSRDDQEILRIQRNWDPDDEQKNARICAAHYRFMPGLGFYGYGLLHMIGGISLAATGALRALMDSAAFSNHNGGYKTRDARIPGGTQPLSPGEWREVDSTFEDLSKAFYPMPYKEPSETLYKLLGYLDDRGRAFIGGEVMTGDANPNAPVGSMLALIEQGGKSFSAVNRRLHAAHRDEFRILAKLNQENIPEGGYPYATASGGKLIFASDFDDRVDVIPVSDPNIISNSQRIIQAQSVLSMAEKYPEQMDIKEAIELMLKAIRVPNVEKLMSRNAAMLKIAEQSAQIEADLKKAELEKMQAEKLKIDAEKTEAVMRGMYSAIQAAALIASNEALIMLADGLYKSAGGIDYNGAPLTTPSTAQPAQAWNVDEPIVQANTSPGFPANPAMPESPVIGINKGIETMSNDGLGRVQ